MRYQNVEDFVDKSTLAFCSFHSQKLVFWLLNENFKRKKKRKINKNFNFWEVQI